MTIMLDGDCGLVAKVELEDDEVFPFLSTCLRSHIGMQIANSSVSYGTGKPC